MKHLLIGMMLAMLTSGCIVSRCSSDDHESSTLNLGPLIGLIGMAVDGDDKDDYEKFFHDDCDCRHCN